MARYIAVEGSYHGTSGDRSGRWYIVDREASLTDKSGRGYASREEALAEVAARLAARPGGLELGGTAEVAAAGRVALATVHSWRARHASFPAPLLVLRGGPLWDMAGVREWLAVERRPGRPAKGG